MTRSINWNFTGVKSGDVFYVYDKARDVSKESRPGYRKITVDKVIRPNGNITFTDHRYRVLGGEFHFTLPDSYYRSPKTEFDMSDLIMIYEPGRDSPFDENGEEVEGVVTDYDREVYKQLGVIHWGEFEIAPDFIYNFYDEIDDKLIQEIDKNTVKLLVGFANAKESSIKGLYFGQIKGQKIGIVEGTDLHRTMLITAITTKFDFNMMEDMVGFPPYPRLTDFICNDK